MASSITLRRILTAVLRTELGFCSRNNLIHHSSSSSLRPLLLAGILSRSSLSELHSSFSIANFSSSIQKKPSIEVELIRIVDSEIECAKEESGEQEDAPKGFPFEIVDEEGTKVITLKRDYHGENIEAVISMPTMEDADENEEDDTENQGDDANQGEEEKTTDRLSISISVIISKGEGPKLEFCCTAYDNEIVIDSLSILRNKDSDDLLEYEGPDFSELDENLQKGFYKYLETRGISTETTSFLQQYLINKDDKEYLLWLQNLKHFLEKQ